MSFATSLTMWLGVLFGQTDTAPAPLPAVESTPLPAIAVPTDTTTEQRAQLEQAVQLLRSGGVPALANQLEAALHAAREAGLRKELVAKQAQLQALQQEIAALQRQLAPHTPIALQFHILKVDRDKLRQFHPTLHRELSARLTKPHGPVPQPDPVTPPLSERDLLKQLAAATDRGTVSILSAPRIVTLSDQDGHIHIGSEFPIPTGNVNDEPVNVYRKVGTMITARPKLVTADTVHCFAKYEQIDPDYAKTVSFHGIKVPNLAIESYQTKFTAQFGETILFPNPFPQPTVSLVFVTVDRPEALTAVIPLPSAAEKQAHPSLAASPSAPAGQPQWISPITLLMRTLLQTDTTLHDGPIEFASDVQYFPAPPPQKPEPTPAPLP
jgi:hypothetical protein